MGGWLCFSCVQVAKKPRGAMYLAGLSSGSPPYGLGVLTYGRASRRLGSTGGKRPMENTTSALGRATSAEHGEERMRKSVLLASVCVLGFHAPAWAQTAGPAADQAATAAVNDYNTIIVTATRRAQALSEVPVAVSAVSAESLERSGVSDIRQLNQLAPSLLVSSTTSDASTSARIRGIGTVGDNAGLESSVAVFIDGVYRVRNGAGLTELGDIERIEVLRGPQGTLFGRNASAGLINVITKKPGFDVGAAAEATYG